MAIASMSLIAGETYQRADTRVPYYLGGIASSGFIDALKKDKINWIHGRYE